MYILIHITILLIISGYCDEMQINDSKASLKFVVAFLVICKIRLCNRWNDFSATRSNLIHWLQRKKKTNVLSEKGALLENNDVVEMCKRMELSISSMHVNDIVAAADDTYCGIHKFSNDWKEEIPFIVIYQTLQRTLFICLPSEKKIHSNTANFAVPTADFTIFIWYILPFGQIYSSNNNPI